MSNIVIKTKRVTSRFLAKIRLDSLALWFAMRHPETPRYIMVILWLVVAYALSPIDLIPDFIPVLGLLDDLLVLAFSITFIVKMLPSRVVDRCRALAQQLIESNDKEPTIFLGGLLIIFLWVSIAYGFYYFTVT